MDIILYTNVPGNTVIFEVKYVIWKCKNLEREREKKLVWKLLSVPGSKFRTFKGRAKRDFHFILKQCVCDLGSILKWCDVGLYRLSM